MATWKEELAETPKEELKPVSFESSRKFFAVDCSGSTYGEIIRREGLFVQRLSNNQEDKCVKWDHHCTPPILVSQTAGAAQPYWISGGSTEPQVVLKQPTALAAIRASDAWVLITDGAIPSREVNSLTELATAESVMQVPVVLLIVGRQHTLSPETTNISVAIPFFAGANDALLLVEDIEDGRIYVVSAKGAFKALSSSSLKSSADDDTRTTWASLRSFANEEAFIKECTLQNVSLIGTQDRKTSRGISLGPQYEAATGCLVNVDMLLQQSFISADDLKQVLQDEALDRLAVICKTRGKLDVLRSLLLRQKRQEVAVRLEDRHGARHIMERLQKEELSVEEMPGLQIQLREAHAANRSAYQHLVESPSNEAREARELNREIDRAMAYLTSVDKAFYTADILSRKSNRAMRAKQLNATDADVHLLALDLSDEVEAFRSECSICCGEGIMSIALKTLDQSAADENTTNFALDFPLAAGCAARNIDMVSSQCICFQCALICGQSIYHEQVAAILPTVVYNGPNERYLNHQLCIAITSGLSIGIPVLAQVFMAILDRVLETKGWCQITHEPTLNDDEQTTRREMLSWMLNNFVTHTRSRETFNETGLWVEYSQALLWALDDFKEARLDSWLIQYPVSGFTLFMRLLERVDQWDRETTRGDLGLGRALLLSNRHSTRDGTLYRIVAACEAKAIHLVVTAMMKALLQKQGTTWAYPFLELVYQGFNAPGVPRDMGPASILATNKFWDKLPAALGGWQDVMDFLSMISSQTAAPQLHIQERRHDLCRRIQLVIFWAVFTQKAHTSPKTFLRTLREREPLASLVLDGLLASSSPVPAHLVMEALTSIFWGPTARSGDQIHGTDRLVPFVSPYGPSILHCGFAGCNTKFYDETSSLVPDPDSVRQLRARHLKEVFGNADFQSSASGLPEPTNAPKSPTSGHCNLHAGIARVWSKMERQKAALTTRLVMQEPSRSSNGPQSQLPAKADVYNGEKRAVDHFISAVRMQVCSHSGRGDIYQTLEGQIRDLLPSFFNALRVASRTLGSTDKTGLDYAHDWTLNRVAAKIEYELSLKGV